MNNFKRNFESTGPLMTRRGFGQANKRQSITETTMMDNNTNVWGSDDQDESLKPDLKNLASLAAALSTNSRALQLKAVEAFRKLLSKVDKPPVPQVIAAGVVTRFVEFIGPNYRAHNKLQFEAAWALTNIASSDHTAIVVELGAVQPLCDMLASDHADIRDQAAWCLGNIAGDSVSLRDALLVQGVLPKLLPNITEASSITMQRNCTWALSNFCRHKPSPPIKKIKPALPVLASLLNTSKDTEVGWPNAIYLLLIPSSPISSTALAAVPPPCDL
jgi:hypothetical protein